MMTSTAANEIDEFSSLFDECESSVDGFSDDLFDGLDGGMTNSNESVIGGENYVTNQKSTTSSLKIPSLSIQNFSTVSVASNIIKDSSNKFLNKKLSNEGSINTTKTMVGMFPFLMNGFTFQPSILPTNTSATDFIPISFSSSRQPSGGVERKRKGVQDAQERRMKNREAADKSRLKKRHLLDILPVRNAELEARVQDLECGLAASQAEANTLREQCNFLKSLLSNKQNDVGSNGRYTDKVAVSPDYEPSFVSHSTQGALLLAVCCILTVNQWGLLMESYPDSQVLHNGGRILLSVSEEGDDGSGLSKWCLLSIVGVSMLFSNTLWKGVRSLWLSPCLPISSRCRVSLFKSHDL